MSKKCEKAIAAVLIENECATRSDFDTLLGDKFSEETIETTFNQMVHEGKIRCEEDTYALRDEFIANDKYIG